MPKTLFLLISLASLSYGQWQAPPVAKPIDLRAAAPRNADGSPNLAGVWRIVFGPSLFDVSPPEIEGWADKILKERVETLGRDRWTITCLPGGPALGLDRQIARIVQTPELIVILYEDATTRLIFLNGRQLPADPNPTWMGYSVGRWDEDTLVVESAGFNDKTWLDYVGHPHTEELRITERFQRTSTGEMDLAITYSDPKAYPKPWTVRGKLRFAPDDELIEYVCAENEQDHSHLVGTVSEANRNAVTLPADVLAKYVGVYQIPNLGAVPVTLNGNQLFISGIAGRRALTPLSETDFWTSGPQIHFVVDEKGDVTEMTLLAIEGEMRAVRKR